MYDSDDECEIENGYSTAPGANLAEPLSDSPMVGDAFGIGAAVGGVSSLVSTILGGKSVSKQIKADEKMQKLQAQYDQQRLQTITKGAVILGVLAIGGILVWGTVKSRGDKTSGK